MKRQSLSDAGNRTMGASAQNRTILGKMAQQELVQARLTHSVIGAFYEVYNQLGFGFLEAAYAKALEVELCERGHTVAREVTFQVFYKGHVIGTQRIDMIVDEKLIVETKASHELHKGAMPQVHSYLHAARFEVGLLLHFGPVPRFYRFFNRAASRHQSN